MFLRKIGSSPKLAEASVEADESSGDVAELRAAVRALKEQNGSLQAALQAKGANFIKCGYLFKYRPYAVGFFDNLWERRFFVLRKNVIEYYRTEADTQFPPRGFVKLESCVVEVEPMKKRRYFTFSIIDAEEQALALRVSTSDVANGERWVAALEAVGVGRQASSTGSMRSPRPSMDIREGRAEPLRSKQTSADLRKRGFWKIPFFPPRNAEARGKEAPVEAALQEGKAKRGPFTAGVPVHAAPKFSVLSSEEVQNQHHAGMINLVMVIMFTTHSRLIIENLLKYGMRFNPLYWLGALLESEVPWQVFACWAAIVWLICVCYWLEVLAARFLSAELKAVAAREKRAADDSSGSNGDGGGDGDSDSADGRVLPTPSRGVLWKETLFALLQAVTVNTLLLLPCCAIVYYKAPPLAGSLLTTTAVIGWMKCISYAHCCNDLRDARRHDEIRPGERGNMEGMTGVAQPLKYPENITAKDFMYFLAAPTLTYQVNFPRSSRFRKRWLARRVLELVAWLSVGMFIVDQYILPSCLNSLHPLQNMDIGHILERVLKLSLPSLYVWLIGFYCLFHLWLNILAEFTYFGDREFYKDWWNATTVDEYWRKWNQPVHKWLMRTVYFPSMRLGLPQFAAILMVFFISAFFHELLVGVPLQMLRAWAFMGMMGQVPLIAITNLLKRKLKSDLIGNVIFWMSFCILGQPTAVLLYYHDYIQEHM